MEAEGPPLQKASEKNIYARRFEEGNERLNLRPLKKCEKKGQPLIILIVLRLAHKR
jgi:hypothetical protein